MEDKVSIICPVYNEEKHVEQALRSLMKQNWKNIEIVVVDDGSSDDTPVIVKSLKKEDDRIIFLEPGRVKKAKAFNIGYEHASGNWIVFFAGDDIMPPNSIRARREVFGQVASPKKDKLVSYGQLLSFSNDKRFDGHRIPKDKRKGAKTGGSYMFSRAAAEQIFPVPECLPNEDSWARLFVEYLIDTREVVKEIVLKYRLHKRNTNLRGIPYIEANEALHNRKRALDLFWTKNNKELDDQQRRSLRTSILAEKLRYKQKTFSLLFLPDMDFIDRLRNIFFSNEPLYKLRMKYFGFFSGR